ncbi:hypothetical protein SNE40_005952 [Patella caerulea]|uniref:Uncharacterized protein n=1 Tax=Patella caerulea TaxID=87958 RepID=A0AAN8K038_PATCE
MVDSSRLVAKIISEQKISVLENPRLGLVLGLSTLVPIPAPSDYQTQIVETSEPPNLPVKWTLPIFAVLSKTMINATDYKKIILNSKKPV